jgi:hypothetical protein
MVSVWVRRVPGDISYDLQIYIRLAYLALTAYIAYRRYDGI